MSSIQTFVEQQGVTQPAGELKSLLRRGTLSSTFIYDSEYLTQPGAYAIDPSMPLSGRTWHPRGTLPGAFLDAAPDRWGRNLIRKQHQADAVQQGKSARTLDDRDYLLGVSDVSRQGALRFKIPESTGFEHASHGVPKLVELPRLLRASDSVAANEDGFEAVKTLLDAGTGSLGGARPKASVQADGQLFIAKFPHHSDEWNVMAWEKTALDLAAAAGIGVPDSQLISVGGRTVLLLERFDRSGSKRLGYVSAMTLCDARDGEQRDYLDIADAIALHTVEVSEDLRQLWHRVAFSIAIHNTDDHLRNHGFLRSDQGWRIAPAFDINPTPETGASRATSIGGVTQSFEQEARSLLSISEYFDLTPKHAKEVIDEVIAGVSGWRSAAATHGIAEREISRFQGIFEAGIEALQKATLQF